MTRLIIFIVLVFAVAAGFAWLADHPGSISLTFAGTEVRTSLLVAAVLLLALLAVLWLLMAIVRAIWRGPRNVGRYMAGRRRERGWQAVSRGMVAIGAGDGRAAGKAANEARQYLRSEPLTLLLAAQAAQLSGDRTAAQAAFEAMLRNEETKLLGLRGLFVEAQRRGDGAAARSFAEEAMRIRPGLGWAGSALLDAQAASGDWAAALETLSTLSTERVIERPKAQRLQAVLLTARAMELEAGDPGSARSLAMEAHRLAPELVPAAVVASRLASRLDDPRRAARIIETTWKIEPHPELAEAYAAVRPGEGVRDRLRRIRNLTRIRANHPEGTLALARAAIDARDWALARESLRAMVTTRPTERACMLMAEIEEGEHGDIGRARDWLARAVHASRDPTWMADGYVFDRWAPVSPVSGRLDAFEWRTPTERIGGPADIDTLPPLHDDAGEATAIALAERAEAAIEAERTVAAIEAPSPAEPAAVTPRAAPQLTGPSESPNTGPTAAPLPPPPTEAAVRQPNGPEMPAAPTDPAASEGETAGEPQHARPSNPPNLDTPPASTAPHPEANGAAKAKAEAKAEAEEIVIPPPPDDPGPEPEPETDGRPRRRRLFS